MSTAHSVKPIYKVQAGKLSGSVDDKAFEKALAESKGEYHREVKAGTRTALKVPTRFASLD